MLADAADGRFPVADGRVEFHGLDDDGTAAIVEFTGRSVVLTDRDPDAILRLGADGFGGASHPDVKRLVAGPTGSIGTHDAVLVARGTGSDPDGRRLARRGDLDGHPRVERSRRHRRNVAVYGDDDGFVTIGEGLVGRREVSVELHDPSLGGAGAGRRLVEAALGMLPDGGAVWAQVSPGNTASLRAFLACGFRPIGAETLIRPDRRVTD